MKTQNMLIPKVIHYCWFGHNPLPKLAKKCIESWKKFLPDYEIKEWNEENFDVNIIPYTAEAYKARKYAFVSDYARFWILYNYGGVYFDTDVEVIKPMDDIIARGPFMGCENEVDVDRATTLEVAPGLGLGVNPGLGLYREILDYYDSLSFIKPDGSFNRTTVVEHVTNILRKHGLKNESCIQKCAGVYIYPCEFFCPMDYRTGRLSITGETRSIHHYSASWVPKGEKIFKYIENHFGWGVAKFISNTVKGLHLAK